MNESIYFPYPHSSLFCSINTLPSQASTLRHHTHTHPYIHMCVYILISMCSWTISMSLSLLSHSRKQCYVLDLLLSLFPLGVAPQRSSRVSPCTLPSLGSGCFRGCQPSHYSLPFPSEWTRRLPVTLHVPHSECGDERPSHASSWACVRVSGTRTPESIGRSSG